MDHEATPTIIQGNVIRKNSGWFIWLDTVDDWADDLDAQKHMLLVLYRALSQEYERASHQIAPQVEEQGDRASMGGMPLVPAGLHERRARQRFVLRSSASDAGSKSDTRYSSPPEQTENHVILEDPNGVIAEFDKKLISQFEQAIQVYLNGGGSWKDIPRIKDAVGTVVYRLRSGKYRLMYEVVGGRGFL